MDTELKDYVYRHLTKTEHLMRDLQQALVLAGNHDPNLDWAVCSVREAVETAAARIRA